MRLFRLPGLSGVWGQVAFYIGLVISVIGLTLVGLNIYYTGATISQLFGGNVQTNTTGVFWPEIKVITGGALGLGFGLLLGVLFFAVEFTFWVFDDYKLGRQARMVRWAVRIVETFDIGASIFLLSGGIYILALIQADWVAWLARFFGAIGVSFLALAFGAEIWLAFGIELMRANLDAVKKSTRSLSNKVGDLFEGLENLKETPEEERARRVRREPDDWALNGAGGGAEQRPSKHGGGGFGGAGSMPRGAAASGWPQTPPNGMGRKAREAQRNLGGHPGP